MTNLNRVFHLDEIAILIMHIENRLARIERCLDGMKEQARYEFEKAKREQTPTADFTRGEGGEYVVERTENEWQGWSHWRKGLAD